MHLHVGGLLPSLADLRNALIELQHASVVQPICRTHGALWPRVLRRQHAKRLRGIRLKAVKKEEFNEVSAIYARVNSRCANSLPKSHRRSESGTRFGSRVLLLILAGCWPIEASAASGIKTNHAGPVIVATVNGQPVFQNAVDRQLDRALSDRSKQTDFLRAQATRQLVDRLVILQWLEKHRQAATDQDVAAAIKRLAKQLGQREISVDDYLQRRRMTTAELEKSLKWKLSWQRFLQRFLTDANLEKYFVDHRREFDGTKLRVAHILLRVEPSNDTVELKEQQAEAKRIRAEIAKEKMSFSEAAQQFSAAPTGEKGGDIGFISRHDPMPESFSKVAFQLEEGEISHPVRTHFGVHLIHCLEVKPGQKRWEEVRGQLETAVTRYLFEWAAEQGRPTARIEISDSSPRP